MENSLHHLLMTNHTAFRKQIFSALKNEGLTSGQPKVLEYLAEHDGAMQKDIAAACRIEPATMTSLLCGMEKKGLITRSAPDRRSLSVYLTEKGRMLIPLIKEEFLRIEDRATCGFSDEERELLISLLSKYSLQGTTQGRYLTGGIPLVRFSMRYSSCRLWRLWW